MLQFWNSILVVKVFLRENEIKINVFWKVMIIIVYRNYIHTKTAVLLKPSAQSKYLSCRRAQKLFPVLFSFPKLISCVKRELVSFLLINAEFHSKLYTFSLRRLIFQIFHKPTRKIWTLSGPNKTEYNMHIALKFVFIQFVLEPTFKKH